MNFFKNRVNIILVSVIFVLCAALVASLVTIGGKNRQAKQANAELTEGEQSLAEANKTITEINEKLAGLESAVSDLQGKLAEKEAQRSELEKQVGDLQKQMELLSARRAALKANETALAQQPDLNAQTGKLCFLTFDDGPSDNTLKILDILSRNNVLATFFVTSCGKTEYLKKIYTAGHSIGLHTATHIYEQVYANDDAYFADLAAVSAAVEDAIGIKSDIIRFPGGSSNITSKKYCPGLMTRLVTEVENRGYAYFDWNVSSGDADGRGHTPAWMSNNVINQSRNKTNVCVLMHDLGNKNTTVQALQGMITGLRQLGFGFAPLKKDSPVFHHSTLNN